MDYLEVAGTVAFGLGAGWFLGYVSTHGPEESRLIDFIDRRAWQPIRSFAGRYLGADWLDERINRNGGLF